MKKSNSTGYPKEVSQKAWAVIDQRREQSRQNTIRRREEVHTKIPEIREIEAAMRKTGAEISRAVVMEPEQATKLIASLADKNTALQDKRGRLLEEHGFSSDYLEERFVCEECKDTGYVRTLRCDCLEQELQRAAFSQLSNVSRGKECNFSTFDLRFYSDKPDPETGIVPRDRMKDTYEFCRQYADNFTLQSESLLMQGHTGLGKTHLSLAIAWKVIEKGYGVVYTPIQQLMDKLEANKFSYDAAQKERYVQDLNSALTCDLLVLDDLGTEFNTSYTVSTLYNIVNTRLVEQRPTIMNTNLALNELEKNYTQRMASRLLFGYKPIRFFGKDIRFLKRASGKE